MVDIMKYYCVFNPDEFFPLYWNHKKLISLESEPIKTTNDKLIGKIIDTPHRINRLYHNVIRPQKSRR